MWCRTRATVTPRPSLWSFMASLAYLSSPTLAGRVEPADRVAHVPHEIRTSIGEGAVSRRDTAPPACMDKTHGSAIPTDPRRQLLTLAGGRDRCMRTQEYPAAERS
jgi:hypothetical protein